MNPLADSAPSMTTHARRRAGRFRALSCLLCGAVVLMLFGLFATQRAATAQATPNFQCPSPTGYGARSTPLQIILDLQCQPAFGETIELPTGGSITVVVNLNNFYSATGRRSAAFNIHLAMDRANVVLRQSDSLIGTNVTDTLSSLQDVLINTSGAAYTFVIENRGLRSAVFDLSMRPRAG